MVDNYERLTISDSEEREKERLERPKIGKQIKRKYDKIKKTNLKINIPDIKELSIDMLTTERILTIVQNDEEKKDPLAETSIHNIMVKQNMEKEEIEIEKNQNLMEKDSNLKKSFQNMEVKLNMDKEESKSEKQQSLKNDKDIEDPLSFHQSLIADMTIISNESEKPNAAFRSCVSESKPSKPNFNHYLDQEFPFDILKKNPVEIIKNQKIEDIKAKNKKKSRFLAWCCN